MKLIYFLFFSLIANFSFGQEIFSYSNSNCLDNGFFEIGLFEDNIVSYKRKNDTLIFDFKYINQCCYNPKVSIRSVGDSIFIQLQNRTFQSSEKTDSSEIITVSEEIFCACECVFCFQIGLKNVTIDNPILVYEKRNNSNLTQNFRMQIMHPTFKYPTLSELKTMLAHFKEFSNYQENNRWRIEVKKFKNKKIYYLYCKPFLNNTESLGLVVYKMKNEINIQLRNGTNESANEMLEQTYSSFFGK